MFKLVWILSLTIVVGLPISAFADDPPVDDIVQTASEERTSDYPTVFLISEEPAAFEQLSLEYRQNLIEVCDFDMTMAYNGWIDMMKAAESHAETLEYDLKGLKMWIKVFWGVEGSVDHIAYYLKPTSKNVDTDLLSAFFSDFIEDYTFPITFDKQFSHYGNAAFPIYAQPRTSE